MTAKEYALIAQAKKQHISWDRFLRLSDKRLLTILIK